MRPRRPAGPFYFFACSIIFGLNKSYKRAKNEQPKQAQARSETATTAELRTSRRVDKGQWTVQTIYEQHTADASQRSFHHRSQTQPTGPSFIELSAAVHSKIVCSVVPSDAV